MNGGRMYLALTKTVDRILGLWCFTFCLTSQNTIEHMINIDMIRTIKGKQNLTSSFYCVCDMGMYSSGVDGSSMLC